MKMWIVDLDNPTKHICQYLLEERKLFQLSNSCNHDYELINSILIVWFIKYCNKQISWMLLYNQLLSCYRKET